MARYEHLPIYKAAYDLNLYVEKIVRHFSRYHKYTLGTELRERARTLVKLIIRANNSHGPTTNSRIERIRGTTADGRMQRIRKTTTDSRMERIRGITTD